MNLGNTHGKSPMNGKKSPRNIPDLRYPGAYPSESEDEWLGESISQPKSRERVTFAESVGSSKGKSMAKSTGYDTGSSRLGPPTPVATPPIAPLSPYSRNPSRMGSSVAESFRTALEDPWLSSDNVSSFKSFPNSPYLNGQLNGPSESKDTVFETDGDGDNTPTQSRLDLSTHVTEPSSLDLENLDNIRASDWDTPPLTRHETAQRIETLVNGSTPEHVESLADKERLEPAPRSVTTSSTVTSQGPVTPPTLFVPNGVWHTPPKNGNSLLSTTNSSPQRSSAMSSASTVIEAIIVTTPKQEPRSLRRVHAAYSLRDNDSVSSIRSSRTASDSVTLRQRHKHSPAVEPSLGFSYERSPRNRVVTEPSPSLRRTHDRNSLREDVTKAKPSIPPTTSQRPYHKRAASDQSPNPSPPIHVQMENPFTSHLQRGLSIGSQRSRASHYSNRGSTHRALQNVLDPSFSPRPSSQADSVVTVVKKHSVTSDVLDIPTTYPSTSSKAPVITRAPIEEAIIVVTPTVEELLVPPQPSTGGIVRRGSDAGSAKSRFSTNTDRFTLKSEDHPRHLFSQTTPFSQISAFSAREAEVGEAQALEIYPHNNHSLLLVEQSASNSRASPPSPLPDSVTVRTRGGKEVIYVPEERLSKPTVSILPSTPETKQGEFMSDVDSPLKNPRKPPLPPKINILPATPMDNENDNPIDNTAGAIDKSVTPARPSGLLQQARRFSDTLLPSILGRSGSLSRHNSYRSQRNYHRSYGKRPSEPPREKHLHPLWQPRDFWENASSSDSEFGGIGPDGEEDFGTLPPGGDTSELPAKEGFGYLGRRMTKKLPGFRGTGGFLIGNSLGLARSGTNVRRHYVVMPQGVRDRRGESLELDGEERRSHQVHELAHKRSSSNLNLAARRSNSMTSLRSESDRQRRRRRQRRRLQLHVEWIGIGGLRDRWRARKAEKRREELRKSIGPKWVIDQGIGSGNAALTAGGDSSTRRTAGAGGSTGSSERSQSVPARGVGRASGDKLIGPPNGRMSLDRVGTGRSYSSRITAGERPRMNGSVL